MVRRPPGSPLFPYAPLFRSAAVSAKRPCAKHSVPAHTDTPTFGMRRNTGASSSRIVSIVDVATPAATDATAFAGVTRDRKEHTSELQSRQYLVCRLLLENQT